MLDMAGLGISEEVDSGNVDPAAETVVGYMDLLATAMSVRETADRIGVSPGTIRRWIRNRSLAAIREGRQYRVPRFQFSDGQLLPSFDSVYGTTASDLPLIHFFRWFVQPSCDLPDPGDDRALPLSPREWLLRGHDPQPVRRIASFL